LKPKYDELLSSFAFYSNLRHYSTLRHYSKVTGVRFMFDDTYLISVGADMTICQWRVVL